MKSWMKADGTPGGILAAMGQVARSVGVVAKVRENREQQYKFRSIDDLLVLLQSALVEHGVSLVLSVLQNRTDTRPGKSGGVVTSVALEVCIDYVHLDGTYQSCTAWGAADDYGDKALNKALTGAVKNIHLHTLSVPTGEKRDSEFDPNKGPKLSPAARGVVDRLQQLKTAAEVAGFMRALRDDAALVDTLEAQIDTVRELAKVRYRKLEAAERKAASGKAASTDDNLTW